MLHNEKDIAKLVLIFHLPTIYYKRDQIYLTTTTDSRKYTFFCFKLHRWYLVIPPVGVSPKIRLFFRMAAAL